MGGRSQGVARLLPRFRLPAGTRLMAITARELENIVVAFLSEGVPAGVVSRALLLDPELVKDVQGNLRVKRYGTDDLTEYLEQAQWDAVDHVRKVISRGNAAEQSRVVTPMLSRLMAVAARRTPESTRQQTEALIDVLADMRNA